MKAKARLRSFWRHNKKMSGMWAMLLQVLAILIPPYHFHDILFVLIGLIWLVVWKKERQIDTMHRLIDIVMHKYLSEIIDHRNDVLAKEEPILEIQQDVIETFCKDAEAFLDSDKTKTFEDGVSFGYNMAMRLCVNEISRLRNELAKAGKQLGGFYSPATSFKIPESFGKPFVIEPLKM